jgi:hypothetical protein
MLWLNTRRPVTNALQQMETETFQVIKLAENFYMVSTKRLETLHQIHGQFAMQNDGERRTEKTQT